MPINFRNDVTVERVRNLFAYDAETGLFRRLGSGVKQPSQKPNGSGYARLRIDGVSYKAHRIAWLHHHGCWPDGELDHVNGIRTDNRISNLRVVSHVENQNNMKSHRGEPSKKGSGSVYKASTGSGWCASLKGVYLGYFPTKEAARAEIDLHIRDVRSLKYLSKGAVEMLTEALKQAIEEARALGRDVPPILEELLLLVASKVDPAPAQQPVPPAA